MRNESLNLEAGRLAKWALALSTFIAAAGSMKMYWPSPVQWAAVFLGVAFFVCLRRAGMSRLLSAFRRLQWVGVALLCFILSVVGAAVSNDLGTEIHLTLSTIVKVVLLYTVIVALVAGRISASDVEWVLVRLAVVSAAALAIACIVDPLFVRFADGRIGWIGAWPGVFWKTGVYLWPFVVWRAIHSRSLIHFPILLLSATIVALDGTRTGLLFVILSVPLLYIIGRAIRSKCSAVGLAGPILALVTAYGVVQPLISGLHSLGTPGHIMMSGVMLVVVLSAISPARIAKATVVAVVAGVPAVTLIAALVVFVETTTVENVEVFAPIIIDQTVTAPTTATRILSGDDIRLEMIREAVHSVMSGFPFGTGLGTTTVSASGIDMHVHNTYLQLLSDIGLLGLLAYFAILLVPILQGHSAAKLQANIVPLSGVICLYGFNGLFVPFSNEVSEWFPVMLAVAGMYSCRNANGYAPRSSGVED